MGHFLIKVSIFFIAVFLYICGASQVTWAQFSDPCWGGAWANPTCSPITDPNCNVDPPLFQQVECEQGTENFLIYDVSDATDQSTWTWLTPGIIKLGDVQSMWTPSGSGYFSMYGPLLIGEVLANPGVSRGGIYAETDIFAGDDMRAPDLFQVRRITVNQNTTNRYIDNDGYLTVDDYTTLNGKLTVNNQEEVLSAITSGNILDVRSTYTGTSGSASQYVARFVISDEDSALNGGYLYMQNNNNFDGGVDYGGGNLYWDAFGFVNATNDYQIRIDADQAIDANDHEFRINNGGNTEVFSVDEDGNSTAIAFCLNGVCISDWDDASVGGQGLQEILNTDPNASTTYQTSIDGSVRGSTSVLRLDNTYSGTNYSLKTLEVVGGDVIMTGTSGLKSTAINVLGGSVQNSDTTGYGVYIQGGNTVSATNYTYGLYVVPGTGSGSEYAAYFGGNVGINTTSPAADLHVNGTIRGNYLTNTGTACTANQLLIKDGTGTNWTCSSATGLGSYWTLNGSDLYPNQTSYYVGVGNTNPAYNLDVTGNIRFSGYLRVTDGSNDTTIMSKYGSYSNGHNIYLQSGNEMVVAGGEAGSTLANNSGDLVDGSGEDLFLVADNNIYFYPDVSNGVQPNMMVNTNGVSIGSFTDPGSYDLRVNGDAWAGSGWYAASDIRLKTNIEKLTSVLDKLAEIDGVTYDWRVDEFPERDMSRERQIGLIAQELEKEFPELVMTNEDGYKSIAYDRLTAVLLAAIKEQQVEIDDINKRLETIEQLLQP